jgi:hypothetical protein
MQLRAELELIARTSRAEFADYSTLDEIGRAAHAALRLLDELQPAERRAA